jgi:hypothetical protein
MSETILVFTPIDPSRVNDPFFDPVRKSRANMLGVTERLEFSAVDKTSLGAAYQKAHDVALKQRMDYCMFIEDDEELDTHAAIMFLSIAKATDDSIYTGVKRLRPPPNAKLPQDFATLHTPWKINWKYPQPADNNRAMSMTEATSGPYRQVLGGMITTPMFYSVAWFEEHELSYVPSGSWDGSLSIELERKHLPFWACPTIHAKHYDRVHHQIYE